MGVCSSKDSTEIQVAHFLTSKQRDLFYEITQEARFRLIEVKSTLTTLNVDSNSMSLSKNEIKYLNGSLLKFYNKAQTISVAKITYRRLIMILESHSKKLTHKLVTSFYFRFKDVGVQNMSVSDAKTAYLNVLRVLFELFLYSGYLKCMELLVKHNESEIEYLTGKNRLKYERDPSYRKQLLDKAGFEDFLHEMYDRKINQYINIDNNSLDFSMGSRSRTNSLSTRSITGSISFKSIDLRSVANSVASFDAVL